MNRFFYHSETGARHALARQPKQDHGRVERLSCGGSLAVAADGHGSPLYARSSRGANLAVIAAARLLQGEGAPESFPLAVKTAWDALVRRDLQRHPPTAREQALLKENGCAGQPEILYGTTLLAARLLDTGEAELYQLGDGEIHVLLADGAWAEPLPADPNCVGCATSSMAYAPERALQAFRHCVVPDAAVVLLHTDGYYCRAKRPCGAARAFLSGDEAALREELRAGSCGGDDLTFAALGSGRTETDDFRRGFAQAAAALKLAEERAHLQGRAREQSTYLHMVAARLARLPEDAAAELRARFEKQLDAYEKTISRLSEIEGILLMGKGA